MTSRLLRMVDHESMLSWYLITGTKIRISRNCWPVVRSWFIEVLLKRFPSFCFPPPSLHSLCLAGLMGTGFLTLRPALDVHTIVGVCAFHKLHNQDGSTVKEYYCQTKPRYFCHYQSSRDRDKCDIIVSWRRASSAFDPAILPFIKHHG